VTGERKVWFAQSTKLLPMEEVASEYLAARRVTVTQRCVDVYCILTQSLFLHCSTFEDLVLPHCRWEIFLAVLARDRGSPLQRAVEC
jgi:hypothetical protein